MHLFIAKLMSYENVFIIMCSWRWMHDVIEFSTQSLFNPMKLINSLSNYCCRLHLLSFISYYAEVATFFAQYLSYESNILDEILLLTLHALDIIFFTFCRAFYSSEFSLFFD